MRLSVVDLAICPLGVESEGILQFNLGIFFLQNDIFTPSVLD
jgi:hypothetical protein